MPKETAYVAALTELGIYSPAFDGEIHQLCILERELSRAMKAWKATAEDKSTAPSFTDPHYEIIAKLRRDILAHRDALGLTPKGMARLRRQQSASTEDAVSGNAALSVLLSNIRDGASSGEAGTK